MTDKRPAPYPLRMSTALRAELDKAAKDNGRSLNAEIIYRLQNSMEPPIPSNGGKGVTAAYYLLKAAELLEERDSDSESADAALEVFDKVNKS